MPTISIKDPVAIVPGGANTLVPTGDSITQYGSSINGLPSRQYDLGFWVWGNVLMGSAFTVLNNAGRGGTRSDEMYANLPTEVIAYRPNWCHILIGTNDANSTSAYPGFPYIAPLTYQQRYECWKYYVTQSIRSLIAAGIRVAIGTIIPSSTASAAWSNTRAQCVNAMNAYIRSLPGLAEFRDAGIVVCDYAAAIMDPSSTTAQPKANMIQGDDGLHPTQLGAYTMGKVFRDAMSPYVTGGWTWGRSITERYSYATPNVFGPYLGPDPLFVTTATTGTNSTSGTIVGTNIGGMTLSKSGTWGTAYGTVDVADRADGFGKNVVITVTNTGAAGDYLELTIGNIVSRVTGGNTVYSACMVDVSGLTNFRNIYLRSESAGDGGTRYASSLERSADDDPGAVAASFVNESFVAGLYTGPLIIPTTPTTYYSRVRMTWAAAGGTGVIKIGRYPMLLDPSEVA